MNSVYTLIVCLLSLLTFRIVLMTLMLALMKARGALGYFLGGYVPPGTPNWHPVLKTISPKIDTPF